MKALEEKENKLLGRREAWVAIEHPGKPTPTRKDIAPEAAKLLKTREELLVVDKIFSYGGKAASRARVLAYSKKEDVPKRPERGKAKGEVKEGGKEDGKGGEVGGEEGKTQGKEG